MIKDSFQLLNELRAEYKAPKNKLLSLERQHKLFKVTRGLYETDESTSPLLLSSAIYGPSYISFETALSFWELIPEKTTAITSATFGKNKTKQFKTQFGLFLYRDVPGQVFPYEVYVKNKENRFFLIAGKEKALCDILYRESPLNSEKQLCAFFFENLRIEKSDFEALNFQTIFDLCDLYKSSNLKVLKKYTKKIEGLL